jgi:hypothetical protein
MGKFFDSIKPEHKEFIKYQHLFFVSTAPLDTGGRINLSPKGLDSFKVFSDHKVAYMDLRGSGNETAAHLLENGRITFMFCSYDSEPKILRLYGKGVIVLPESSDWDQYAGQFNISAKTRQIIVAEIDLVQTSCGYGVPLYEYAGEREKYFKQTKKE